MSEEEVFDLLDGGYITKWDLRGRNIPAERFNVEIGDCDGDLSDCYGATPESAWDKAVVIMLNSLWKRKRENSEANEPTLSAGERNPGL